jgi:hypothetical protein
MNYKSHLNILIQEQSSSSPFPFPSPSLSKTLTGIINAISICQQSTTKTKVN